jgi:hypothetical protein
VRCCFPDGTCDIRLATSCTGLGGTPGVFGTTCEPNTCPQPNVACCFPSGACTFVMTSDCLTAGGVPGAFGSTCSPNLCPQPETGACCVGTTCSIVASNDCTGTFKGASTTCDFPGNPVTCCPANFNQASGVTVQDIFDFLTAWNSTLPTADFNGADGVTVQDIFDFLTAWNAGCP